MSNFFILIDEQRRQNVIALIGALNLSRPYSVEVKQYRRNRSNAQNRLYWSWVNTIADDTGNEPDALHEMFKARFLGIEQREVWGQTVAIPKSTTGLTTQEFTGYLEKIEATATAMGLRLPHPDDYRYAMHGEAA